MASEYVNLCVNLVYCHMKCANKSWVCTDKRHFVFTCSYSSLLSTIVVWSDSSYAYHFSQAMHCVHVVLFVQTCIMTTGKSPLNFGCRLLLTPSTTTKTFSSYNSHCPVLYCSQTQYYGVLTIYHYQHCLNLFQDVNRHVLVSNLVTWDIDQSIGTRAANSPCSIGKKWLIVFGSERSFYSILLVCSILNIAYYLVYWFNYLGCLQFLQISCTVKQYTFWIHNHCHQLLLVVDSIYKLLRKLL